MEHSASASASAGTSSSSSQRRELQGPRPAPLRVHKESHKVRKPPAQVRQPVIIYTVSPKVVHTNPSEFMSVVQRLTGVASSSSSSSLPPPLPPPPTSSLPFPFFPQPSSSSAMLPPTLPQPQLPFPFQLQSAGPPPHEGAQLQFSPAARLAAMEQASASAARCGGAGVHPAGGLPPLPSILSPVPGSLPAIPASFFSPQAAGGINLFGELISPAFLAGASSTSPPPTSQYFTAAPSTSPYYWDLFNNNHHL